MMTASPASMVVSAQPANRSIVPSLRRAQFSPTCPAWPPAKPNGRTRRWPDKMGEQLFAKGIRIIDDPLRKRGLRSHPFDGEGVAGRRLSLIEDGLLQTWILDLSL